jgi:hypothetical protein
MRTTKYANDAKILQYLEKYGGNEVFEQINSK